jgi:ketosteroid isomerase-like protein
MTPPPLAPAGSDPVDRQLILAARIITYVRGLSPGGSGDRTLIKRLRAASNAAIARHDAVGAAAHLSDDAQVLTSGDTRIDGRAAMIKAFERAFGDANFVTYVRRPERVTIHCDGGVAAEYGHWTAVRRNRHRGGLYLARWARTPEGWSVRSETYTPLI